MSFMYNPFPYDDPRPVNRPALPKEAIDGLVTGGSTKVAATLAGRIAGMMDGKGSVVVAFDGYTTARLPANLLQAQRDYFGAHTYERIDAPRGTFFHTNWTGHGGSTSASTYNA